jgi:nucleotide-binding universal stress UspA family protein
VYGGIHASTVMSDLRREGAEALNRAREAFPDLQLVLMRGSDVAGLLDAAAEVNADLISVGSHGGSRMAGITFGSVASGMAHYAPCSVLIARTPGNGGFPGLILHASDGSSDSLEAARVAGDIAAGHGSKIITVNIGDDLDRGQKLVERTAELIKLAGADPVTEAKKGSPHRAIVELANSARASLVVVGSRGLTGIRALGSVSERVAHRAPCSVLVVRRAGHPKQEPESADTSS